MIRWIASCIICCLTSLSGPAHADRLTVHVAAGGEPLIEARVNGEPVRLLLALDGPRILLMNGSAAERLALRANPLLSRGVSLDVAGHHARGRTGRATVSAEGRNEFRQRVIWFPDLELSALADGVIGPAGLRDFDMLTVSFSSAGNAFSEHVFTGLRGMEWRGQATAEDIELRVSFSLSQPSALGSQYRRLERRGLIERADGSLGLEPFAFLGHMLAYRHQNVSLAPGGIAPESFIRFARSEEVASEGRSAMTDPARPDSGVERIVVQGEGSPQGPVHVTLGRETLSQCAEIAFDYRTDTITVRCPGA